MVVLRLVTTTDIDAKTSRRAAPENQSVLVLPRIEGSDQGDPRPQPRSHNKKALPINQAEQGSNLLL